MSSDRDIVNAVSALVIGRAFVVSNSLGPGFLEKVYANALAHELRKAGLEVCQHHDVVVRYDGIVVGTYVADMLVDHLVLVELKAVKALAAAHVAQCLNYLKATGLPLCVLVNFGTPRIEIRRLINGF